MLISELSQNLDKQVTIKGWLTNSRSSKGIEFIILRDGSGFLQCVVIRRNIPVPKTAKIDC